MKGRFIGLCAASAVFVMGGASAAMAKATRFWNLTDNTITKLQLAPAGTQSFGPDQCKNDKDGTVEHDERLKIVGVPTGTYDVRFSDAKGRMCTVKNIAVKDGDIFSVDEKQLGNSCSK